MQLPEEAKKFDKINKESVAPRPVVSMRLVAISRPRAWSDRVAAGPRASVPRRFKTIMKTTHESPVVVRAATEKEFDSLTEMGDRLDKCQKSLTDYLDTKRNAFSRFYFISDDELLSVLGSSDPTSIQVHMLKLFDNVKELKFGC